MSCAAARRRASLRATVAALLFVLTCAYRFTTMGGVLGGFENDQFIHLSRAQQIVLGDAPIRDFVEPGMLLTDLTSAAAQATIGRTLFSEAVLTIGMLALSTVVLFLLAERASGSIAIATLIALLQIAMAPRFYNYPKLLLYGVGIAAIWAYLDRPDRRRLFLLALAGVVAFLFRHDHGAYIGTAAIVGVAAAHWPDVRTGFRQIAVLGAMALALVTPFLVYVQLNGGVSAYLRTATAFAVRDAGRTDLTLPAFTFDLSRPLVDTVPALAKQPAINVRWADLNEAARVAREREHGLIVFERLSGSVWKYSLTDASRDRLKAIVTDPGVADTQGIDRETFSLNDPELLHQPTAWERFTASVRRLRVLPGMLQPSNAVPFLFYLFVSIPVVALILAGAAHQPARKIGVVAALALLMSVGLLRGSLPSRLADVTEVVGVLAAWIAAVTLRRPTRRGRLLVTTAATLVLVLTALSVDALEGVTTEIGQTRIERGIKGIGLRARSVYQQLSAVPPAAASDRDAPGSVRIARYLAECTQPSDRVFALGYASDLFVMSGRGFAGGVSSTLPGFYGSDVEQRQMLARLASTRVPIAVTAPEPEYTAEYRPYFALVDAFLRERYVEAGVVDAHNGTTYRILVRRDLQATGTDHTLRLPCYR